jgi:uncharacterized membrane protein YsdA (DUF1294 family)
VGFAVVSICVVAVALAAGLHYAIPLWLCALAGLNVATAYLYAYDKGAAIAERPRVPEALLHVHALLGGSPAALVSQAVFRHKTVKRGFRALTWAIFVLQVAVLAVAWAYVRPS